MGQPEESAEQPQPAPLWGAHDVALEYGWGIRTSWDKLRLCRERGELTIAGEDHLTNAWLYKPAQVLEALRQLGYSPRARG